MSSTMVEPRQPQPQRADVCLETPAAGSPPPVDAHVLLHAGASSSKLSLVCAAGASPASSAAPSPLPQAAASSSQPTPDVVHFNWETQGSCRGAIETLIIALKEDPVNAYFCGTKGGEFARDEVKGYVKALPAAGHFLTTPDANAAALWQLLPEETPKNELWAGWTRVLKVPLRLWRQLLDLELHYEAAHEAVAAARGSYYYLSFIGTRPAARGKGQGSLLLSYITNKADAEGRVCLLEATSARSRALYERHGFICYEEFRVRPKAPPVFFMLREPRAHPAHPADTSHHKQQQAAGTSGGGHVHFGGEAGGKAPSSGGRGSLELRIPAVRSVQALEAAEQAATAAELCALRLGQLSPERCSSNESGDEAVFVSHANLPAPSAELVHAMSLKQAAATAMALAAAVLEEEQAEALLAAQQEQQQQGQQEAEQCTHGGGI